MNANKDAYNDILDRKAPQRPSDEAYMNAYRFWLQTLPESEQEKC
jgi:hypothetical protein